MSGKKLPSKFDLRDIRNPDVQRRLKYAADMVDAINMGENFKRASELVVRCKKCGAVIKDKKGLVEYCGTCLQI